MPAAVTEVMTAKATATATATAIEVATATVTAVSSPLTAAKSSRRHQMFIVSDSLILEPRVKGSRHKVNDRIQMTLTDHGRVNRHSTTFLSRSKAAVIILAMVSITI